ncbi:MAG: acetyl-CoA carboxylase carboxyltransferase subunit beta [Hyphomicrobiales bacterium]|nr:MAG: acetyl-CoA carboxylase carboxyltransferase subunit beta [Hyphomicrobiales bacterium]
MNWINNVVRPKIRSLLTTKREVPENLWVKCPDSGQMVFYKDLEANQFVIPGSNYHMRMDAQKRLASLFDDGVYEKVSVKEVPQDPLKFRDGKRYSDRLKTAKSDTELDDAVLVGEGRLDGQLVTAAAQDFRFMAGSLGMAAGEAVVTGMLHAVEKRTPFILFAASGGARMQEGILSLMQMPRTTIAVQRLRQARLPYLVVLTDPTTGGVTASYAMLGDVHIAEPGALICFAGPRVIQQTIREQLPEGFQKAEYLLAHGMIDMVVHRHKMRETLSKLCRAMGAHTVNAEKGTAKPIAAISKASDRGYMNGNHVDGRTIEELARASDVAEQDDAPAAAETPRTKTTDAEKAKVNLPARRDAPRT